MLKRLFMILPVTSYGRSRLLGELATIPSLN
jgi:hypothetical protein